MMKPSTRHKARRLALQAIYQWQMSDAPINEIDTQFRVKSPN
jgi:N utilization substance protein B